MKTYLLIGAALLVATSASAQMTSPDATTTTTTTSESSAMQPATTTQTTTMVKSPDGVTWENGKWMHGKNHATTAQIEAHEKWMKANNVPMPPQ